jgi:SAM-dependent methyltransferase
MKTQVMRIYRSMPTGLRRMITHVPLVGGLRRLFEADTSLHDEFYTEQYYEQENYWFREGPALMCRAMTERFRPSSVLDVGCGTGDYLKAFRDQGVEGHGVELAAAALKHCREKGLDVVRLDLSKAREFPWKVDLTYSFEVAEHLPPSSSEAFVGALTASARRGVVISAAPPGQPGLCHINCRPKSYWVDLFARNGFSYDEATATRWREDYEAAGYTNWLFDNLMVFEPAPR